MDAAPSNLSPHNCTRRGSHRAPRCCSPSRTSKSLCFLYSIRLLTTTNACIEEQWVLRVGCAPACSLRRDQEQLGRRDEVAELIEWHFQIIRAFLPDDQSNGARRRAGPVVGSHIHCRLLLSGFEIESRGKNVKSARD